MSSARRQKVSKREEGILPSAHLKKIALPERGTEILFDDQDKNVRLLESLFDVRISARGAHLVVQGQERGVQKVGRVLEDFSSLVSQGQCFSSGELREALHQIADRSDLTLRDFYPKRLVLKTPLRQVVPRSPNQVAYVEAMRSYDLVFAIGPAGTGKTYLGVAMALSFLTQKIVQRIVLARPAVEAGERLGFLPGDIQDKVNPYLRPLYDALFHMLGGEKVQELIERRVIEIAPLAFMRGRTLRDSFVILDEAQNSTSEQMKMFLTRIGLNSRTLVTGDITQIDLPRGQRSGLIEAGEILRRWKGICFCEFDGSDVVRHPLVKLIIQAYQGQ